MIDPIVLISGGVVLLLVGVADGAATSVLFARLGRERWRGWLPIVRDAELLRMGQEGAYVAGLLLIPPVSVYALWVKGRALYRIGLRWGWGPALAVLGALVPLVWALLAAVRAGGGELEAAPEPVSPRVSRSREPALGAGPRRQRRASDEAAASGAGPGVRGVPLTGVMPAEQLAPVAPAIPEPMTPDAIPAPSTGAPSRARAIGYELVLSDGSRHPLDATRVIVGRAPRSDSADVQLLSLTDGSGQLSKSHAELMRSGDIWFITDLHSTNGVIASVQGGAPARLAAGACVPVTGEFQLGGVRGMIRPIQA